MNNSKIAKEIHRILVCQWVYNWSDEEVLYKISDAAFKIYFEQEIQREKDTKESLDALVLEFSNYNKEKYAILEKEKSNRKFGKYVKRKHRY